MEDKQPATPPKPAGEHVQPGAQLQPGDRAPAQRSRRLERAPGERYAQSVTRTTGSASSASGPSRAAATAAIGSTVGGGALVVGILGSFDLGAGMLVVATVTGWAVALAVVWAIPVRPVGRPWLRPVAAALLAAGSMVGGLGLLWAWALVEGGVLGPVAYADARFGPLAPLLVLAAGAVAAVRAR